MDTLENIMGKGENADTQHFLLFQQCFIPFQLKLALDAETSVCHLQNNAIDIDAETV